MLWPPSGDLIWHYTSAKGLLGIINTQAAEDQKQMMGMPGQLLRGAFSMWFTDALYLNDPMELGFGRDLLADSLSTAAAGTSTHLLSEDRQEIDDVLNWLRNPALRQAAAAADNRGGTYIACFSTARDSLTQWRNYAPGRGYAIGFDPQQVTVMVPPITDFPKEDWEPDIALHPRLYPVVYGEDATREWFKRISSDIVTPIPPGVPRRYVAELALATAKQQAYEDEKEWRAIFSSGPTPLDIRFRDGPLGVTPYISVGYLPTGAHREVALVREIMVGPGEDIEVRRAAVEQLLRKYSYEPSDVPVTKSDVLYRG